MVQSELNKMVIGVYLSGYQTAVKLLKQGLESGLPIEKVVELLDKTIENEEREVK